MLCYDSCHLVIYCECCGFERAVFTLRHFFFCTTSCFFQGFPGASSSTSELAGLHSDPWNIAPAELFVWITAIHKRFIYGRFYLRTRAGQSGNIKLYGELVLQNISLGIFPSCEIWTFFVINEHVQVSCHNHLAMELFELW